jgi:hypothetical protein
LGHIAQIGASPTADKQSNAKNFKKDLTDVSLTDINKPVTTMNRQQRRAMKKDK